MAIKDWFRTNKTVKKSTSGTHPKEDLTVKTHSPYIPELIPEKNEPLKDVFPSLEPKIEHTPEPTLEPKIELELALEPIAEKKRDEEPSLEKKLSRFLEKIEALNTEVLESFKEIETPSEPLTHLIETYENTLSAIESRLETEMHQRTEIHSLLHELHATLIHAESGNHKDDFLHHHKEALEETNTKWFHEEQALALEYDEGLFEAELEEILEELRRYEHRIKHLIESFEREAYEKKRSHALEPHPTPAPPSHDSDDDKT